MNIEINENDLVEKTRGIRLSQLGLSNRLYNCLRHGGYYSLTDVMLEEPVSFLKLRNFGVKTNAELLELRDFVLISDRNQILEYIAEHSYDIKTETNPPDESGSTVAESVLGRQFGANELIIIDDDGFPTEDMQVIDLHLSVRTENVLLGNGIETLKALASLSDEELRRFKGLGNKSLNEVYRLVKERCSLRAETIAYGEDEIGELIEQIERYFEPLLGLGSLDKEKKELIATVHKLLQKNEPFKGLEVSDLDKLAGARPLATLIKRKIMSSVPSEEFNAYSEDLLISAITDRESQYATILRNTIQELINDKQLRICSNKICRYKLYLEEWLTSIDGRDREILELRLSGMTLEEVGNKLSLTRERVRQIYNKVLRTAPKLYEDDYSEFIERYLFTREEFSKLLGLTARQINYLCMKYKRGDGDLQAFLDDERVPTQLKDKVHAAFKKKTLIIDGEIVPLKRPTLLHYLLKTYYSDAECTPEEFANVYYSFLDENGLRDNEELLFPTDRAMEARIIDSPFTIQKYKRLIRYYDTEAVDINKLLSQLEILLYDNTEISTLKLFRAHPEVMDEYDIRDEYELHNIIRKKLSEITIAEVHITRMPFLTIGNGDRTKQVEDLLLQMAPVANYDLATEYEERFGVRAPTVLANFFKCIDDFYHDGIYDLEQQDLSEEEYNELRKILVDEFYSWNEITQVYRTITSTPKDDAINAMTLKRLGFKVLSNYVVSSKYLTAEDYFRSILLRKEIVDLNDLPKGVRAITAFSMLHGKLRDSLELIEVNKDVYYSLGTFVRIYSLESKDELLVLGESIVRQLGDFEYASINKIIGCDMLHGYPEFVNNPYILNSILRVQPNVYSGLMGEGYIITHKGNDFSLLGLISYIIEQQGDMKIASLIDVLSNTYDIKTQRSKIRYVLNGSKTISYDEVFDYVCKNDPNLDSNGPVYLSESRLSGEINEHIKLIQTSETSIAQIYWKEKYEEFVDYCGMNGWLKMKDILKLDFSQLLNQAVKLNIPKSLIPDLINIFMEWVAGLSKDNITPENNDDILNMFFS